MQSAVQQVDVTICNFFLSKMSIQKTVGFIGGLQTITKNGHLFTYVNLILIKLKSRFITRHGHQPNNREKGIVQKENENKRKQNKKNYHKEKSINYEAFKIETCDFFFIDFKSAFTNTAVGKR